MVVGGLVMFPSVSLIRGASVLFFALLVSILSDNAGASKTPDTPAAIPETSRNDPTTSTDPIREPSVIATTKPTSTLAIPTKDPAAESIIAAQSQPAFAEAEAPAPVSTGSPATGSSYVPEGASAFPDPAAVAAASLPFP